MLFLIALEQQLSLWEKLQFLKDLDENVFHKQTSSVGRQEFRHGSVGEACMLAFPNLGIAFPHSPLRPLLFKGTQCTGAMYTDTFLSHHFCFTPPTWPQVLNSWQGHLPQLLKSRQGHRWKNGRRSRYGELSLFTSWEMLDKGFLFIQTNV